MTSPDYYNRRLAELKKKQADLEKQKAGFEHEAAKKREEAERKRQSASRTSSTSLQRTYLNSALTADTKAAELTRKAANLSKSIADNLTTQLREQANLRRAEKTQMQARDREDERQRQARDREDERRRQREKQHAREIARLSQPTARYLQEVRRIPAPKPEKLRILYLTANPRVIESTTNGRWIETRIRVDLEVRNVREEVRRALHRDSVEIDHWPAATPLDLTKGLNEKRPHVVHFSGHGGGQMLEFDDGQIEDPTEVPVTFDLLARALTATTTPPIVLVLNACDTLDGAEVLLEAVPVVIATTTEITDVAANVFAAQFYGAVAYGQSVRAALDQARYAIDVSTSSQGNVIASLTRENQDLDELVLVQHPRGSN